jgi:pyruvate dehydrogenase E1 component alpha subunit/2-oxoisovalerate dehydrogenase E1 component alpha subunit
MIDIPIHNALDDDANPSEIELIKAFKLMVLARTLDDKMASLYRMGKIHGGVFLGRGQEAVSVAMGVSLRKGDVLAPLIRDGAGRLAFGEPLIDAVRTYLGSSLGPMRGRDGNVHRGRPMDGILPMISHLGAMISVVNGSLMAHRFKGITGTVGVASIGDGATSTGSFHEALNQAAVEKLPLVLVVANNRYAYSTPNERQFACKSLLDKASGYGVSARAVDGTDLSECMKGIGGSIEAARKGEGPQFVLADMLRLCGHGEHDDASYVDPGFRKSAIGVDCVQAAENRFIKQGTATAHLISEWKAAATAEVEIAVARVQQEPAPDPYKESWCALSRADLADAQNEQCVGGNA